MNDAWKATLYDYWTLHCCKYPPIDQDPLGVDHQQKDDLIVKLREKGFNV